MISQRLAEKLLGLAYTDDEGKLEFVELHEGDILFEQGDEAHNLYVLKAGVLGVRVGHEDGGETTIARLAPEAIVGEMALLSGNKRSATVYAINDAGLIRISREQFEQLMMEDETALAEMSEMAEPRWQRQQLHIALRRLLGNVDAGVLDTLRQHLSWQYVANGDVVFTQGEDADGMCILVNGRLQTFLRHDDGSIEDLGRIGPGEPVGEMGVLTDKPRVATVYAVRESNLVKLTQSNFKKLVRLYPDLMIHIARIIVERQQRLLVDGAVDPWPGLNVVLIPTVVGLDALQFGKLLGRELSNYDETVVLDGAGFDEKYGEDLASQTEMDDVGNTAIVAFMNELDLTAPYIVYVADPFDSAWTQRCIAHADHALVLAKFGGDPRLSDAELLLANLNVPLQRDLVFVHSLPAEGFPDVTAWLEARPGADVNFIGTGDNDQLARLAKRLTKIK